MATPVFHAEVVTAFRMIHMSVRHPQYVDEAGQVLNMRVAVVYADEIVVARIVGQALVYPWLEMQAGRLMAFEK